MWRARARLQTGQIEEARRDAELSMQMSGGEAPHAFALSAMAMAAARAGDSVAARGFVERILGAVGDPATSMRFAAMALVGVDNRRALELLESIRPRGMRLRAIIRNPEFDLLRSNPQFRALQEAPEN